MQSIVCQCQALDNEFSNLDQHINGLLDELTPVSLEFVNAKLNYLRQYSSALKNTQLDARQHRNAQVRNLIEYIKLHTRNKAKSVVHSPATKGHRPKYSLNDTAFQSVFVMQTQEDERDTKQQQHAKILRELINKQKSKQRQSNESIFDVLKQAVAMIESKKEHFVGDDYNRLKQKYYKITNENKHMIARSNLKASSSQIKENLQSLMQSHQSFQSYLNSIV